MTEETPPTNRRKRRLAAGAAVLGAGALLAGPITAFAQQDDDDTETETETETPATRRRPERPFGGGKHWRGGPGFGRIGLEAAAEVIGIEEDDLREALRDGTTLAELAEQNGVDVQAVVDALVAEATDRITTLVNEGFPD